MKSLSRIFNITVVAALLTAISLTTTPVHAAGGTTITVTTEADTTTTDTFCSLREAITNANDDAAVSPDCAAGSGNDTIAFANNINMITLGSDLPDIADFDGLTIHGGGDVSISGNDTVRIFNILPNTKLILESITMRNGYAVDTGGGVQNQGNLTISNSILLKNRSASFGGGIHNMGTLNITNSVLSENSSEWYGGGIANSGPLSITDSTFTGNQAGDTGGAIDNADIQGILTITNSTFSGNSSINRGGSIFNGFKGTMTMVSNSFTDNTSMFSTIQNDAGSSATIANSTFYNNDSSVNYGIIQNDGEMIVTNNTFSNNNPSGGMDIINTSTATTNLYNNIFANNVGSGHCDTDDWSTISASNNLMEGATNTCDLTDGLNGNIIGSDAALGLPSGSPAYLPLNSSSPAIDAGDDAICAATPINNTSQNGVTRPKGKHCDIGSYEFDQIAPVVVSSLRANTNPTSAASTEFTVTFSKTVKNVDIGDFILTTTGVSNSSISGVSGSGVLYTISVNTGLGSGTIRLDLIDDDSIVDENLIPLNGLGAGNGNFTSGQSYTINKLAIFSDVPLSYWANNFIERLYNVHITGGCNFNPLQYCPENPVSRDQMAIFLERGIHGAAFTPPNVLPTFNDIAGNFAENWIEALKNDGITGGCGNGSYCPTAGVTRAQMAIFIGRSIHGPSFIPPNVSPTFNDTAGNFAEDWIESLKNDGITGGCGDGNYCPDDVVTRAQMAVFLVKTFNLP